MRFPCAFCQYLAHERPYTIIHRDDVVAIMVTREQRGIPHLLVLPVRHVPTLLDISDAEAYAVAIAVRQVCTAISGAYERPGISVWQNNGISAGQTIPHVHFHVAGTLPKGGTAWGEVPELSVDQTDRIADKLQPFFRSRTTT